MNAPKKRDNWNLVAEFFGMAKSEPPAAEVVESPTQPAPETAAPEPPPLPKPMPQQRPVPPAPTRPAAKGKRSWSNIASSLGLEVTPEPEPVPDPVPAVEPSAVPPPPVTLSTLR